MIVNFKGQLLRKLSTLCLETRPLIGLKLINLISWLTRQAQGSNRLCLPRDGIKNTSNLPGLFPVGSSGSDSLGCGACTLATETSAQTLALSFSAALFHTVSVSAVPRDEDSRQCFHPEWS